jgi:acyl-coenzyme A thioesterase PaaI-like protein
MSSALVDAIPYARFLGVQVQRRRGGIECVLPFRDEIIGNARLPAVHGGVLGAFLELTALLRLIDESRAVGVPKPINFSIDYLRSAGPKTTTARADIFKLGRRIANVHVVAWQDDPAKPVAHGNGKFLLRTGPSRTAGPRAGRAGDATSPGSSRSRS